LGYGSQTVMPPSTHNSGRQYTWKPGHGPNDIAAAPAPAWLLYLLTEGRRQDGQGGVTQGPSAPAAGPATPSEPPSGRPDAVERARRYLGRCERCHREPDHAEDASTHLLRVANALTVGFSLDVETAAQLLHEWDRDVNPQPFGPGEC